MSNKKFKLPEDMNYREVKTGKKDENGKDITVKVKLTRRQRREYERSIVRQMHEQADYNAFKDSMVEQKVIGKNDILNAIQNLHSKVFGGSLTRTAEIYVKERGIEQGFEINDEGELVIVLDLQPIIDKLTTMHVVDDEGNDVLNQAKEEVEQEVEEILENKEGYMQLLEYPRDFNGIEANYVSFDKESGQVAYETYSGVYAMHIDKWLKAKLLRPEEIPADIIKLLSGELDSEISEAVHNKMNDMTKLIDARKRKPKIGTKVMVVLKEGSEYEGAYSGKNLWETYINGDINTDIPTESIAGWYNV